MYFSTGSECQHVSLEILKYCAVFLEFAKDPQGVLVHTFGPEGLCIWHFLFYFTANLLSYQPILKIWLLGLQNLVSFYQGKILQLYTEAIHIIILNLGKAIIRFSFPTFSLINKTIAVDLFPYKMFIYFHSNL